MATTARDSTGINKVSRSDESNKTGVDGRTITAPNTGNNRTIEEGGQLNYFVPASIIVFILAVFYKIGHKTRHVDFGKE